MRDRLDVLKKTGRYDAFKLKWHKVYEEPPVVWPVPNHLFWDSDVAKWIEGACYILKQQSLPVVDQAVKELVDMIKSAQQPDGYLNIHYTVVEPGKRFTNLRDMHELYNAGHLIEAALAHEDVYGNQQLLEPMLKYVDLLCATFGPSENQVHGYPGHPEIELALLRLYEHTKDLKHLDLARFFITERGNPNGANGCHFYYDEARRRGDDPHTQPAYYPRPNSFWYQQAHLPIGEQASVEGHSVRAMYLLTAVADLVRLDNSSSTEPLKKSLFRLWSSTTQRKMYVTGGIGAMPQWEGFGIDYFLPQGTDEGGCYSETCAAIGVMMIERHAKYADIMELCFYNAVLTAMSHDGERFTYDNQLASSDTNLSKRDDWFTVACCPPSILRLLGQIGGYVWSYQSGRSKAEITVNLYVPSQLSIQAGGETVQVKQSGDWPWDSDITFELSKTAAEVQFCLRIPGWAPEYKLHPPCPSASLKNGYLTLPSSWTAACRTFVLSIPLRPRWVTQHPFAGYSTVSLMRGPVVYCVEDADNTWVQDHFKSTFVDISAALDETRVQDKTTNDEYVGLHLMNGAHSVDLDPSGQSAPYIGTEELQSTIDKSGVVSDLNFVPYFFRGNRGGKGHMRVGLKKWP
ncbi:glycoside hydrolase family 127 protein [Hortaea werneckii]|nr:glycoside hydrolase family 127 protein [Hortaea werneckii]KAI7103804.1 glycoside hydrolase family 127 protein [Hortaea werneckii]